MNLLITGALGQLGTQFKALEGQRKEDHFLFTDIQDLDITSKEAVSEYLDAHEVDVIINCAAYTAVDKAEDEPGICDLLNHKAPLLITRLAKSRGIRMVQISTDYVFDGSKSSPYRESDPTAPLSVYGQTKADMERDILKEDPTAIVIRTAWLYSQWGRNFPKTILRLLSEKDAISVVNDQVGSPTWTYDLARAILSILDPNPEKGGIFHFSGEGSCSWYDFAQAIRELSGITSCQIRPVPSSGYPQKAKRPSYSTLDKTLVKETFHIEIPHWKASLKECLSQLLPIS